MDDCIVAVSELNRFDKVAGIYDRLASMVFGKSIRAAHTDCLEHLLDEGDIAVLGGGTGWWLPAFLKSHPRCRVYYIEASKTMIELAQTKLDAFNRVEFLHGTEEALSQIDFQFDAVITCFYLDLFSEQRLARVVSIIDRKLNEGGRWCVADFACDRWWHHVMLHVMYSFFRAIGACDTTKLPAWQKAIASKPMKLIWHRSYYGRFIRSLALEKVSERQHIL